MILAKQLELQESNQGATPTPTPRSNLAKELEKYNRPMAEMPSAQSSKLPPPSAMLNTLPVAPISSPQRHTVKPPRARDNAPERPNILSRRPHFKPRYNYLPSPTSTLCTMGVGYSPTSPAAVTAPMVATVASSSSCSMVSGIGGGMMPLSQPLPGHGYGPGQAHIGVGPPPQGAALPPSTMAPQRGSQAPLNVPQPSVTTMSSTSCVMNVGVGSSSPMLTHHDAGSGMGSYSGWVVAGSAGSREVTWTFSAGVWRLDV